MSDQAIDGRHHRIELLLSGIPQYVADQVTDFSANPTYDEISSKVLGMSGQIIDKDFTGWKGKVTLDVRSKSASQLIDAYNLAKRNMVPMSITLVEQVTYRDRSTQTHMYVNCELEFDQSAKRGSASQTTINWVTGSDRTTI